MLTILSNFTYNYTFMLFITWRSRKKILNTIPVLTSQNTQQASTNNSETREYIHLILSTSLIITLWSDHCMLNVILVRRHSTLHWQKNMLKSIWKKRKFVFVLQHKRIFLFNKEYYICLLLYFKDPLLKSRDPVLWLKYDFLKCKCFFS